MADQSEPILWLEHVLSDSLITAETAAWAAFAWGQVRGITEFRMPPPAACTGPDGEVFFGWGRGRYHLELEIVPGRAAEWFYRDRDREAEESWLEYQGWGDPIPDRVLVVLGNFIDQAEAPRPTDAELTRGVSIVDDQTGPITWLERVLSDSLITAETAAWAAFAWGQVRGMPHFRMPPPVACTGPNGEVFFGWDRGRYHLELEIVPGRAAEWSFLDRMREEPWLEYQGRGDPIPDRVFAVLGDFIDQADAPRPTNAEGAEGT